MALRILTQASCAAGTRAIVPHNGRYGLKNLPRGPRWASACATGVEALHAHTLAPLLGKNPWPRPLPVCFSINYDIWLSAGEGNTVRPERLWEALRRNPIRFTPNEGLVGLGESLAVAATQSLCMLGCAAAVALFVSCKRLMLPGPLPEGAAPMLGILRAGAALGAALGAVLALLPHFVVERARCIGAGVGLLCFGPVLLLAAGGGLALGALGDLLLGTARQVEAHAAPTPTSSRMAEALCRFREAHSRCSRKMLQAEYARLLHLCHPDRNAGSLHAGDEVANLRACYRQLCPTVA